MKQTIVVFSDLHYHQEQKAVIPKRRRDLGPLLARRLVERCNRRLRPDLVLFLGDCLDEPQGERAPELLRELRACLDRLKCPWFALPGNHDPAPDAFYAVMPRPPPSQDLAGLRLLVFDRDGQDARWQATRSDDELARLRAARADGFRGRVVAAQHVNVMPSATGHQVAFNYLNADAIGAAATAAGVDLCIGGHAHVDTDLRVAGGVSYLGVPALCEAPFAYTVVTLDDSGISRRVEPLALPPELALIDTHSHSQFAYCSEDMHLARNAGVAALFGLRGLVVTEHSGQLYFPAERFWGGAFCEDGMAGARPADNRANAYFAGFVAATGELPLWPGLEVDVDYAGKPIMSLADRTRATVRLGAVHYLKAMHQPPETRQEAAFAEFRARTTALCRSGIHVLAHPDRVLRAAKLTLPPDFDEWLVKLLRDTRVAAELNFHHSPPTPAFVQRCLESKVRLALGSDAHGLWELGELSHHLALLAEVGVTRELGGVLWQPPAPDLGTGTIIFTALPPPPATPKPAKP